MIFKAIINNNQVQQLMILMI